MWLGMCVPDKFTSRKIRIAYVGVASVVFALNLFCVLSNAAFFVEFISVDLKSALFAFMTISGFLAMLYTLINAFNLRYKINEIFEKLSEIYCERESILFVLHEIQI